MCEIEVSEELVQRVSAELAAWETTGELYDDFARRLISLVQEGDQGSDGKSPKAKDE